MSCITRRAGADLECGWRAARKIQECAAVLLNRSDRSRFACWIVVRVNGRRASASEDECAVERVRIVFIHKHPERLHAKFERMPASSEDCIVVAFEIAFSIVEISAGRAPAYEIPCHLK